MTVNEIIEKTGAEKKMVMALLRAHPEVITGTRQTGGRGRPAREVDAEKLCAALGDGHEEFRAKLSA